LKEDASCFLYTGKPCACSNPLHGMSRQKWCQSFRELFDDKIYEFFELLF